MTTETWTAARRHDWVITLVCDVGVWAVALAVATLFRFEFAVGPVRWAGVLSVVVLTAVVQLVAGYLMGFYRGRYGYGTFEEVRGLTALVIGVSALVTAVLLVVGDAWQVPRSLLLIAGPIALVLMLGLRYIHRLRREARMGPGEDAAPTLIYGAGMLGEVLARRMQIDSESEYRPVGFLDDDPGLRRRVVRGVPVVGALKDLRRAVDRTGATELIVAIAAADNRLIRAVADAAAPWSLHVRVLPVLDRQLTSAVGLEDLRNLSIEDLIGREPVDTQVDTAAEYLAGKRVLVTGAGGSIGSELCRQIVKYAPAELIMVDRDETALQDAQLATVGHGLLDTEDVVLVDIRDVAALNRIFQDRRPEVVYHAAALKHLPMLEQYPEEAWKSNVLGTLNVLEAARAVGVDVFINISTDKAANPTSALGHSKRVAEKLTAWMARETGRPYLSVRFGNVIGSRGSMLPTFRRLIEQGGPVTVTHPEVTRYFMTIPEAGHLVIQAGAIGRPGEVMILDMGEPVRILDIAQRMIAMSGKDVPITFTGLRHGEKLHEELIGHGESDDRPFHAKISHAAVDALAPDALDYDEWLRRTRAGTPRVASSDAPARNA
ncbi:nucleoside-diphosphate sugar epimerase/dehydratase [uncultured Micrococcus sp.]|uniref:nucleoside-diphosphate sugar epimerase/dehydratase n=1 Tax=uncultured Micrococcus sp. TaxID=114051 RepID=UPI00260F9967|nr:nucleoside-diphosphate sugar epimerase/dehydratase [uncultured Micrococcus sp.]